jgi:2-polyprenyl-6-methoxyphenol hydroxylase-like FAD-dependent oxidoreductase
LPENISLVSCPIYGRSSDSPSKAYSDTPARSRVEHYKLQRALLSQVPEGTIRFHKRLISIDDSGPKTYLRFEDRTREGPFDMVVGADGLRSVVRQHAFPHHKIAYTGRVAYRVLIPQSKVAHIPNMPQGSCFWHTPLTHVYTCPLDNGLFEIATRAIESEERGQKVGWGRVVAKDEVVKHYDVSAASHSPSDETSVTATPFAPSSTRRTIGLSSPCSVVPDSSRSSQEARSS